jgi:hypothetical protein
MADEKKPYRVTDAADGSVRIAGRFPREGDTVHLTDKEALWEERRGLVEPVEATVSITVADPLDHDGDGRKGGSLPGRRRKA